MTFTQGTLHMKVTVPFLFGNEVKCHLLSTLLLYSSVSSPFNALFSSHIFKFCTHLQCPLARSLSCTSLGFVCGNFCEGYKYKVVQIWPGLIFFCNHNCSSLQQLPDRTEQVLTRAGGRVEVVASLSQGHTAAAQCGLFTHKSVPVIFEQPCSTIVNPLIMHIYSLSLVQIFSLVPLSQITWLNKQGKRSWCCK